MPRLSRENVELAREIISRYELGHHAAAIHLSPVHGVMNPRTLAEWVLADNLPARVQLQLHKFHGKAGVRTDPFGQTLGQG